MKALVTGGAGFIGSHVVDALLGQEWSVTVVDNLSSGKEAYVAPNATFERLDITSADFVSLVCKTRPDAVYHFAAKKDVQASVRHPRFDAEANILGSLNVLDACVQAKVPFLLAASTGGAIYDGTGPLPATEQSREFPLAPYGISKMAVDHYLRAYHAMHGLRTVSLRYANVYGPRQDPEGEGGVVAIFLGKLLAGKRPTIFGNGEQTRDYVYVGDAAQAALAALQPSAQGIYNVGTGVETSVNVLFHKLCAVGGFSVEAQYAEARPREMLRSSLDSSRLTAELGWKQTISLNDGLTKTLDWFQHHSP